MKKIIIVTSIIISVVIAGGILAAILLIPEEPRLSGTYSNVDIGTGGTLVFDGNEVTATYSAAGEIIYTVKGTYKIDEKNERITITLTPEDAEKANVFAGEQTFERGDDYIRIGGIPYKKTTGNSEN